MIRRRQGIKSFLKGHIINSVGWKTSRKIVVIESDDWGSIRMPTREVFSGFINKGFNLTESTYNRLDTIERNADLEALFEVLHSFKDHYGNHPVFTANMVVGNPDFNKIRQSEFREYFFEPVTETLKRYKNCCHVEALWKEGDITGLFHPQFHGREHVNITRWMTALREGSPEIMYSFDNETTFSGKGDYNFMEVLDFNTKADLSIMKESLHEGLEVFENIFGYRSESFIPPCYIWSKEIEEELSGHGIKYIQGVVVQSEPRGSFGNYRRKYHYLGEKNDFGQYYLIRNCMFEPSLDQYNDPVGTCLERIKTAFIWGRPAIIGTHRINYIGSLIEENRVSNLRLLRELLRRINETWEEVEYMTSDKLGNLISANNSVNY